MMMTMMTLMKVVIRDNDGEDDHNDDDDKGDSDLDHDHQVPTIFKYENQP